MMKSSLQYSAMNRDEIKECAQLAVSSFDYYDYFIIYFPHIITYNGKSMGSWDLSKDLD